jgi:hypothetical protein
LLSADVAGMAAGRKESEMKIYHKNSATIHAVAISIGRVQLLETRLKSPVMVTVMKLLKNSDCGYRRNQN